MKSNRLNLTKEEAESIYKIIKEYGKDGSVDVPKELVEGQK